MTSNVYSCGLKLSHFSSDSQYQLCSNLHEHVDESFHPHCVIYVTFCKLIEVPNGEEDKVIWQFHRPGIKYWSVWWLWVYLQGTLAHVFAFLFPSVAYKTFRLNSCATSWKSRTKERRLIKQISKGAATSKEMENVQWKLEELIKILQQSQTKRISRNYHQLNSLFSFTPKLKILILCIDCYRRLWKLIVRIYGFV